MGNVFSTVIPYMNGIQMLITFCYLEILILVTTKYKYSVYTKKVQWWLIKI